MASGWKVSLTPALPINELLHLCPSLLPAAESWFKYPNSSRVLWSYVKSWQKSDPQIKVGHVK